MKKENRKWIILGVIILLVVLSQGKKEAIETMLGNVDEFITSDFIIWYSGTDKSYRVDQAPNDELIEFILEFHAIAKSPIVFDSSTITQINNELANEGFSYRLKSSYSCSDIKPQLDEVLQYIKTEMESEASGSEFEEIYNIAKNNLIDKLSATQSTQNGKTVIKLNLPSVNDLNNFCQEASVLLSYEDYTNMDFCNSGSEDYDMIRDILYSLKPTVVCDGNYMFLTFNNVKATQFTAYTKDSNSFDGFRNFYMQDIGKVDGEWALASTIKLNACYVDSDCNENEECNNMKCIVIGTEEEGEGGIEEDLPSTGTTTDDKEFYEQPFVWIIFGLFMMMMVMMKK